MAEPSPPRSSVVRFGSFELNLHAGELRRNGAAINLHGQPIDVLSLLLEKPGELVTREDLRQKLWSEDTFVDFEHGLNAAVKRLRAALGDDAEAPRYIETVPRRGYRFIAPLDGATTPNASPESITSASERAHQPPPPARWRRRRTLAAAAVVTVLCAALAISAIRWIAPDGPGRVERTFTRLTFDPGLQTEPTWSPDGRFIAYSSDRAGNFDIWVQAVAGGDAVQVTKDPAHDWQPDWSPDGSLIAFRSERDGGGILVIPALGGDARKLSSFGYRPRWSPDGSRIVLVGTDLSRVPQGLYTVALDGRPPEPFVPAPAFRAESAVTWHPDGRLSFMGYNVQGLRTWVGKRRLWTASLNSGPPVSSELKPHIASAFSEDFMMRVESPAWAPSRDALYFVAPSHEVRNVWKVSVDPSTLEWTSSPYHLTTGPEDHTELALSHEGRKLAVSVKTRKRPLWSYPFDPIAGRITGAGEALTNPETNSFAPDLTRDGKMLIFQTEHPGRVHRGEMRMRSLDDGRERLLLVDNLDRGERRFAPRWSPDGARVAYRYHPPGDRPEMVSIRIFDFERGDERTLTSPVPNLPVYGWSPDGQHVLASFFLADGTSGIWLLPVHAAPHAEKQARVIASHEKYALYQSTFSPDGRWISFIAFVRGDWRASTIYVVPAQGGPWTPITEGTYWDDKPRWSPDGRAIYFASIRSGTMNVWGIRFDPNRGTPVGRPFQITDFRGPARMVSAREDVGVMELAVSRDRLVVPIEEVSGHIWMLDNVDR